MLVQHILLIEQQNLFNKILDFIGDSTGQTPLELAFIAGIGAIAGVIAAITGEAVAYIFEFISK